MRGRLLERIATRIGGYDLFISYRHSEATRAYAMELERVLESRGLVVFLDESEEDLGVHLGVFEQAVLSARMLVVLAAPGVFGSVNVRAELASYLRGRIDRWYRRPFSRVVSINVDQTLSKAPADDPQWDRLSDFVYVEETLEAVERGVPGLEVVERLSRGGSFMKSWQRFLAAAVIATLALVSSATAASIILNSTIRKLSVAEGNLAGTRQQAAELDSSNRALGLRNAGLARRADALMRAEERLTIQNRELASRNGELINQGDALRREANDLERQARGLRETGRMLGFRLAAGSALESDPVAAYRLAAEAYRMSPAQENGELVRASLSRLDLMYSRRWRGYSVEDVREPYVLLSTATESGEGKTFSVLDLRTAAVTPGGVSADGGWIVSLGAEWRIVGVTFPDFSFKPPGDPSEWIEPVRIYQLWDRGGGRIGEPVEGRSRLRPQFIDDRTARIPLPDPTKMLLWDVATDTRRVVDTRENEQSLATRSDGSSAVAYYNGLLLLNAAGARVPGSFTVASFDDASAVARWSADGRYLAVYQHACEQLGVWDPAESSFVRLDRDGWIVESCAWSGEGHLLAFSGRTEKQVDVTVEVVDVSAPVASRRIVHRGVVPISGITFLTGGEKLVISDTEGRIQVVRVADGAILSRGWHEGVNRLFTAGGSLFSASPSDLREWGATVSSAVHWSFVSSGARHYADRAAADATWTWLAVPFVDDDSTTGIELRRVDDGSRRVLSVPQGRNVGMEFSGDGRWLVVAAKDTLQFFDTGSWEHYDFPSRQFGDEFTALRVAGDTVFVHALGRIWLGYRADLIEYVFVLGADHPRLERRVQRGNDEYLRPDRTTIRMRVQGWQYGTPYRYHGAWLALAGVSGWAYQARCRAWAVEGSSDCDVQFLPAEVDRLMGLFDPLLWRPTAAELAEWVP